MYYWIEWLSSEFAWGLHRYIGGKNTLSQRWWEGEVSVPFFFLFHLFFFTSTRNFEERERTGWEGGIDAHWKYFLRNRWCLGRRLETISCSFVCFRYDLSALPSFRFLLVVRRFCLILRYLKGLPCASPVSSAPFSKQMVFSQGLRKRLDLTQ